MKALKLSVGASQWQLLSRHCGGETKRGIGAFKGSSAAKRHRRHRTGIGSGGNCALKWGGLLNYKYRSYRLMAKIRRSKYNIKKRNTLHTA